MLVPDATSTPVGFHDVMLEDLSNTQDHHARLVLARDITSLRRHWPPSVFMNMHRGQADMETMRHACKREFDSEVVVGPGLAPHCGIQVLSNLSRHIIDYHLELGCDRLFHQHGRQLVHRYRIYRDPLPHVSLR